MNTKEIEKILLEALDSAGGCKIVYEGGEDDGQEIDVPTLHFLCGYLLAAFDLKSLKVDKKRDEV